MLGFHTYIVKRTEENENHRSVLFATPLSQLEVMSLDPGEDISLKTSDRADQFIQIEEGCGIANLDGEKCELKDGVAMIIPADTKYGIRNTSSTKPLKLISLVTGQDSNPTDLEVVNQIHFAHW